VVYFSSLVSGPCEIICNAASKMEACNFDEAVTSCQQS
jgi:hypothetical protein